MEKKEKRGSKNNQKIKSDELKKKEQEEKLLILAKADEVKYQTLGFDIDGNIQLKKEIEEMMLEPIDNPQEKHELYYKVVNKLLRDHLPKGKAYKPARDYIFEEKNTFLTAGHRKDEKGVRGADGRMAYIPNIYEFINMILEWISENGTMIDLYTKIRDKNVELGYGKPLLETK